MPAVYKKIHHGDFRCPSWFSSNARRVVTRLIDLNPSTRITVAKLVETSWFKKLSISRPMATPLAVAKDEKGKEEEEEEPKRLNAFHLISLSESFDLSPLLEQGGERREEGMRFTTRADERGDLSTGGGGSAGGRVLPDVEERTDGAAAGREGAGEEGKASGGGGDICHSAVGPGGGHPEGRRRHA